MTVAEIKSFLAAHGLAPNRALGQNFLADEAVASAIGMDRSTFYRKLKDGGEKFTIGEIHGIVSAVPLSREEAIDIFFTQ